jgi:hypothetical protein
MELASSRVSTGSVAGARLLMSIPLKVAEHVGSCHCCGTRHMSASS